MITLLIINHWEILTASAVGLLLLFFSVCKVYRYRKYHLKDLKALGFYRDEVKDIRNEKSGLRERRISSSIKVFWKSNKLVFTKYNRAFGVADFQRLKPNLETLFHTKIELLTFEKQWFSSQPKIIIHTEAFPAKYLLSERPKLKVGQLFLGIDALIRTVILEAIKKFENTLLVLAPKGSGKSVLLNGIITSFYETLVENKKENDYELIIVDNKGTDFIGVVDKFNGSYYQPFNIDDLRQLVGRLTRQKIQIEATLAYLKSNRISPQHWDEIRNGRIDFPVPPKLFLVFDEMKAYFGSGKQAPKLPKDPSPEELVRKEKYDLLQELGHLTNFFAEQCRSTGIILICASQSPNKSDYDYPDFINLSFGFGSGDPTIS